MYQLIEPRLRKNLDRTLLFALLLLLSTSVASVYAATCSWAGIGQGLRQGVYFVAGLFLMTMVAARDYRNLPRYVPLLYGLNIALLLAVELFGDSTKGAARWIKLPIPGMDFKLQPSEFAKLITIITLSTYVSRLGARIREFPTLMKTLGHVLVPTVLIMKQPDLGTSLVLIAIWAGTVFLAGARLRHLGGLALAGVALFAFAWQFNILHDYQKHRVHTFLDPMSDPKGKGYQVLQSMYAVGGGQVTGHGFRQGLQTNNGYIPENHTDFVFTVVGEEAGFVGACVLLTIYGLILYRCLATIAETEDPLGRLMVGGVATLFAFHVVVNMGMVCGIMPVVGVPLPLMSFGGSAAWANLMSIGLVFGVHMRRHKILF